jgi:hypothetical protein
LTQEEATTSCLMEKQARPFCFAIKQARPFQMPMNAYVASLLFSPNSEHK